MTGQAGLARLLVALPQFRVADVVQTAEWYRDMLGFTIGEYAGEPPVFTHVRRDYVVIQIGRQQQGGPTQAPGGLGHNAYLFTDDVDALARELAGRDVAIVEGPVDRAYPCRELIVKDCNGLTLCFATRRA